MAKWVSWILKEKRSETEPVHFGAWRIAIASGIAILAILFSLWGSGDPYWLAFETGFQELIARRHLDPGLSMTHGLSTLNNLGPAPTFHSTHPPLLQLILAGLFALLGDSEGVARIVPIGSFWAILWGIWKLTRPLSPDARLFSLAAAFFAPISFYTGRIVNFEAPVLACIVWTLVGLESLCRSSNRAAWLGVLVLGVIGTLIDWPYALFVTCLFALSWLREDTERRYFKAAFWLWFVSMVTASLYAGIAWSAGVLQSMAQHAQLQTGMMDAERGFQWPPFLVSWTWWHLLGTRLLRYGTPVLSLTGAFWLISSLWARRHSKPVHHSCLVLFVFNAAYIAIFSRASYNHLWCLFYIAPLLSLCFGLVLERIKTRIGVVFLIGVIASAYPILWDLRYKKPLLDSVQAGRSIAAASNCLPRTERSHLSGPLLYVNRVDPLPYYAGCETAFSHLSVRVAAPDKFLIRYRPEFVVLSGYKKRSSITVRPEYPQVLFDRLAKSYTLVHSQEQMEIWESLWSPNLSILGFMQTADGSEPVARLIDDQDDVHLGLRVDAKQAPITVDLTRVSPRGRRWLHGWTIAYNSPYLEPVEILIQTETGKVLDSVRAIPQKNRPRWQEFWLPVGELPEKLIVSWEKGSVVLGDWRLINETLWAQDWTQILASEIQRRLGTNRYEETLLVREDNKPDVAVLQHPGFGVDRIDLPPWRIGHNEELQIVYGLSPEAYEKSDGVLFRVTVWDHALGRSDLLLEEFIDPKISTRDSAWRSRSLSLREYSRHVVEFGFEVNAGPQNDTTGDLAIWREIRIVGGDSR